MSQSVVPPEPSVPPEAVLRPEPTLLVGIDCGSKAHVVCALDASGKQKRQLDIPHSSEGFARLISWLREDGRDPRSIADQVDGLISSAEETERGVKDLEEILSDDGEGALLGAFADDIEAELQQGRAASERDAAPEEIPANTPH